MGVLDALLEGFIAAEPGPPASWRGRFDVRDQVSVPVKGGEVVGRVLRASGARPDTHVVIDPGGGQAHVEAEVGRVRLHTPESYAASAQREAAAAAQGGGQGAPGAGKGSGGGTGGGAVREASIGLMLEGFAPAETPAQSQAIGAKQVATAQKQLSAWSASKHPRAQGGRFGYSTGGRRVKHPRSKTATRSSKASSRTLGVGARGALVKSLQRQLHIPADGIYGPQTRAAVTRFQQQHGLQVDGQVGRQTLAALRGNPRARSITPGPIASKTATVRVHRTQRKSRKKRAPPAPVRMSGGIVI